MAKMCESCIYTDGYDGDLYCLALENDCENITDEECDSYSPIMDSESDEG